MNFASFATVAEGGQELLLSHMWYLSTSKGYGIG